MNSYNYEDTNVGYTQRTNTRKYWCHLCKKEFIKIPIQHEEIHCMFCNKTFCEEIEENNNDQPSTFVPYENSNLNSNPSSTNNTSKLLFDLY